MSDFGLEDVAEAFARMEDMERVRRRIIKSGNGTWGRWSYEGGSLVMKDEHNYRINLTRIQTTEFLAEWQMHLLEKSWITAEDLGNLALAVAELSRLGLHEFTNRHRCP